MVDENFNNDIFFQIFEGGFRFLKEVLVAAAKALSILRLAATNF